MLSHQELRTNVNEYGLDVVWSLGDLAVACCNVGCINICLMSPVDLI